MTRAKEAPNNGAEIDKGAANIWIVLDLEARKKGSLEQGILALAKAITSEARLTVVLACEPMEWLREGLSKAGATIKILDFRRPGAAAVTFAYWMALERPTLVHFHFIRAYSALVAAARAAGARVPVHDHITLGVP